MIPDFQNPSGRTWSLARRKELLEVAARLELPVVEDAPYRELRFEGDELPALAALDRDGRVIFTSTFSKVLCPGLRIGWVAAPRPALEKYVLAKQAADLHTSTLAQLLVSTFMEEQDVDRHIASIRSVCRERRDAMLRAADEWLPREVRVSRPAGGPLPVARAAAGPRRRGSGCGAAWRTASPSCRATRSSRTAAARMRPASASRAPRRPQIVEGVRRMAVALREMSGAERLFVAGDDGG